jgi:hypothetical protein
MSIPIGVLIRGMHVVCLRCSEDGVYRQERQVAIWPVNLERYDQDCHDCGATLTAGSFKCQLYDAGQCPECKAMESPAIAIRAAAPDEEASTWLN